MEFLEEHRDQPCRKVISDDRQICCKNIRWQIILCNNTCLIGDEKKGRHMRISDDECKRCSLSYFFLQISTVLVTVVIGIIGFNLYSGYQLDKAKEELEKIKKEYMDIIYVVKDFKEFSPEDFDSLGSPVQKEAEEAMKIFRNIFIASAILSNKCEDSDERIEGWKVALRNNPDSKLCYYGLGMAYFKAAIEFDKKCPIGRSHGDSEEYEYINGAIKNLSNKLLINTPTAQYHLALAHLRMANNSLVKYKGDRLHHAYLSIDALEKIDRKKENSINIDYNMGIACCIISRNTEDRQRKKEYLDKAIGFLDPLKNIPDFGPINKHYSDCTRQNSQ